MLSVRGACTESGEEPFLHACFHYQFTNSPGAWGGLVSAYEPSFGSSQFYAFDQSGNTRVATHKPGDVTSTVDYTAFGTEYYLTGGSNLPFRFGGRWGYYTPRVPIWILYIQQRWLDVALAQWTSRDPIGFEGGDWNLCRYVANNPDGWIDPSGQAGLAADPFQASCVPNGGETGPWPLRGSSPLSVQGHGEISTRFLSI
jgi:RHS repeat-associated protein